MNESDERNANPVARWSVGGIFLEGLATRNFAHLASALGPSVQLRALLPPGAAEFQGREDVAEAFGAWFGSATEFELVDAEVGEVGGRLHLSWRLRMRPAPFGIGDGWHVIEQQAYADGSDAIERLDLLCSGFQPELARSAGAQ